MIRRLAIATVFSCWAALVALACKPLPDPETPPVPVDPGPPPDPTPAATACGRAAQHALALHCTTDALTFEDACSRYESLGGASAWHPDCMADPLVTTCQQLEACRSK